MSRTLLAFAVGFLSLTAAQADVAFPPAPGKRFLPLQHRIEALADHPGYDFYTVADYGATKVEFGAKSPALVYGTAVRRGMFVAVPKGAREKFKSDDDHKLALLQGTIPGQIGSDTFELRQEVPVSDKRAGLVYSYTLEKLDEKGRMLLKKSAKAPAVAAPPEPAKGPSEDGLAPPSDSLPSDSATLGTAVPADGYAPRGGAAVAGVAAALALALSGFWLVRRMRT